jgi:hypothetical protein
VNNDAQQTVRHEFSLLHFIPRLQLRRAGVAGHAHRKTKTSRWTALYQKQLSQLRHLMPDIQPRASLAYKLCGIRNKNLAYGFGR